MKKFFWLVFALTFLLTLAQSASAGEVLGDFDGDHTSDIAVYGLPTSARNGAWLLTDRRKLLTFAKSRTIVRLLDQ